MQSSRVKCFSMLLRNQCNQLMQRLLVTFYASDSLSTEKSISEVCMSLPAPAQTLLILKDVQLTFNHYFIFIHTCCIAFIQHPDSK
jgi:hypothetical protein